MVSVYFPYALGLMTFVGIRGGRVLLALYALQMEAPTAMIGLLAATFSVPPMLFAYKVGQLTDRFGSRWTLLVGIIGASVGVLVPFFHPGVPSLFVAAFLNGIAFTFFNVSMQNAVGQLSTPETRVKNFANLSLVISTAQFVAPVLIGFAIDHAGANRSCLFVTLAGAIPILMLMLRGDGLPRGSGKAAAKGGGLREMLSDPAVRRILAISSLMMTGYDLYFFYMPVHLHGIGYSASAIGVMLGIFSGAGLLVRTILPWLIKRFSVERVLVYSFYIGAAGFFMMPMFRDAWVLGAISFVFGLAMSVGQPITMALSFTNATDGRSGAAMGLRQMVNHGTRVAGPLVFGFVGTVLGGFGVFWINALMLAWGGFAVKSGRMGEPGS